MCYQVLYHWACGHTSISPIEGCPNTDLTDVQCDVPTVDEIDDHHERCTLCIDDDAAAEEQALLRQTAEEHRGRWEAQDEEALRLALEASMEGLALGGGGGGGDFDAEEMVRVLRVSAQEAMGGFESGDFVPEGDWAHGEQRGTGYGHGGGGGGGSAGASGLPRREYPARASQQTYSEAAGNAPDASSTGAQWVPDGSEGEEDESSPQQDVPPQPSEPEPDTTKPFVERFKKYVGCQHTIVEDTKIERDQDSPPCFKAIERGMCPKCESGGGTSSIRQGKQPKRRDTADDDD